MSLLVLDYDGWRGGFCLHFGPSGGLPKRSVFDWLAHVCMDERERIMRLESAWDYGGVPLRSFYRRHECPRGVYPVTGTETRLPYVLLRQTPCLSPH
jgi:hypothetical protein